MPDPNPTVGELSKAEAVTDEQVNAAADAFLAEPETGVHAIADGYSLDLAAAVAGHRWASEVVANPDEQHDPEARRGPHGDPAGAGAEGVSTAGRQA